MSQLFNAQEAIAWAQLIKIAYDMNEANPDTYNPLPSATLPADWAIVANLTVEPTFSIFKKTNFIGFVVRSKSNTDRYGIVFRGTSGLLEWLDDFESALVPFADVLGGGNVEEGFYNLYKSLHAIEHGSDVSVPFAQYIDQFVPYAQVTVTGHSLGGALANLTGAVVADQRLDINLDVYSFAAPMVGDQTFVNLFNARVPNSFRIYNVPDIVPNVPLSIEGYRQVNIGLQFNSLQYSNIRSSISAFHSLDTYIFLLVQHSQLALK